MTAPSSVSEVLSDRMPCTARTVYIVYLLFAIVQLLTSLLAAVLGVLALFNVTLNIDSGADSHLRFLQVGDAADPIEARTAVPRLYLAVASTVVAPILLTVLVAVLATYVAVRGISGHQLEVEQQVRFMVEKWMYFRNGFSSSPSHFSICARYHAITHLSDILLVYMDWSRIPTCVNGCTYTNRYSNV